jgi:hypothetical protein
VWPESVTNSGSGGLRGWHSGWKTWNHPGRTFFSWVADTQEKVPGAYVRPIAVFVEPRAKPRAQEKTLTSQVEWHEAPTPACCPGGQRNVQKHPLEVA